MAGEGREEFASDFKLFLEGGFIAVKQFDEFNAKKLFHAAQLLRPESSAPKVGMGFIALNKLEVQEAERIFTEIVRKEDDHQLARTFLGMSYLLQKEKRKKGEELIAKAIAKTDDPTVIHLGKLALEWSEKELKKKSKSPYSPVGDE